MPEGDDEIAVQQGAQGRHIELETMNDYGVATPGRPAILLLGYAQLSEDAIRTGVTELADVVKATRAAARTTAETLKR
jgi:hypothetical protein